MARKRSMGQLHVVRHVAEQRATGDSITLLKAELNNEDSNEEVEAVKKKIEENGRAPVT